MTLTPARAGLARSAATRSGYPVAQGAVLLLYALSNVARSGATRSNYHAPTVFISIGGVHYGVSRAGAPGVIAESLSINDQLYATPTTATMTTVGFIPQEGQEVIVTLGSKHNDNRDFAGTILSTRQFYQETPAHYRHTVNLIDYTWGLDTKLVRIRFVSTTVAAIAASLMASYAPGYTLRVAADIGATAIDEITFTEQALTACLTQLAKRVGGAWRCDYRKAVRLFFIDEGTPPTLINAVHHSLTGFEKTRDLSQTISRQYVEGGGSAAAGDVPVGETVLPVTAGEWYETAGGVVVCGPQRIAYASRVLGGTGGLVGPGAAPSAAPLVALASGSGIPSGPHSYAVTFKTLAGECLPGPVTAVTVGPIAAPTSAPVPGDPQAGSGPDPGSHDYAVTFVTATGETTPGPRVTYMTGSVAPPTAPTPGAPTAGAGVDAGVHDYAMTAVTASGETTASAISGAVTTRALAAPYLIPTMYQYNDGTGHGVGVGGPWEWHVGDTIELVYVYHLSSTSFATGSPPSSRTTIVLVQAPGRVGIQTIYSVVYTPSDPAVTMISWWIRNLTNGSPYGVNMSISAWSQGPNQSYTQNIFQAGWNPSVPFPAATDTISQIPITVPLGAAGATGRKLYRRSGGAGLRLARTINDNTTTSVVDTLPNASLGAAPPSVNTAALQQVLLSSIPTGGPLVTGRRLYRTKANVTALLFLVALGDNTTTSLTDTLADASLGAAPPATTTALANRVQVSAIPTGAAAVIARVLYRTMAYDGQLKKLVEIADNGATTSYLDAVSDVALGAIPPVSDTSGLTQPGSAQVPPGSTSLPVANIGAFEPVGGWAIIGNGDQVIRYHGKTASTLTGIPASGNGAIIAAISWNSTVTAAAALHGIPASGAGAITVAIIKGDEVNLFVQVDDLEARATIAAFLGTDGIIEDYLQDRRLSHREALARATAQLETKNQVRVEIRYQTRDLNQRTGRLQQVNLGPPFNLQGSFLIQSVTERPHAYRLMPTFDSVASNARFTFDEFLRMIHDEVT